MRARRGWEGGWSYRAFLTSDTEARNDRQKGGEKWELGGGPVKEGGPSHPIPTG